MAAAATASTTAAATTKAPAPKAKPAAATKAHQHRHATAAASSTASTSRKQRVAITTPFSTAKPTKQERVRNDALERVIREAEVFTDDSEQSRRELVLGTLSTIVQQFVKQVGLQQGLGEPAAKRACGRLVTYGSYHLGVHTVASDIDVLCLAPRHVARDDFFRDMPRLLSQQATVTGLHCVPEAFVPVIKFTLGGVPIDLVFCQLSCPRVGPELDLGSLKAVELAAHDPKGVMAINGYRVTAQILQLVPHERNFQITLRAVKYWAKRRGVYANVMGYLGGINWAILVARVCQLFPAALPAKLLRCFFRVMDKWKWPTPVLLCALVRHPRLSLKVWDPVKDVRDSLHLMPILTPAYPSMNSAYNVSTATLRVMKAEFKRAATLCSRVAAGNTKWPTLFSELRFFTLYRWYLQVEIVAGSADAQHRWLGWCESRMRHLATRLEGSGDVRAHLLPRPFSYEPKSMDPLQRDVFYTGVSHCTAFFVGLELPAAATATASTGAAPQAASGGTATAAAGGGAGGGAGAGAGAAASSDGSSKAASSSTGVLDLTTHWVVFAETVNAWPGRTSGMDLRCSTVRATELPDFALDERSRAIKRRRMDMIQPRQSTASKTQGKASSASAATAAAAASTRKRGRE